MKYSARTILYLLFALVMLINLSNTLPANSTSLNYPTFYNYEDYLSYLDKTDLPAEFITYEDLKPLGEFYLATIPSNTAYNYSFIDSRAYHLNVWIYQNGKTGPGGKNYFAQPSDLENMLTLPDESSSSILRGPLEYVYVKGELLCILWNNGDTSFSLSGNSVLSDYPTDGEPTILDDLVSTDDEIATGALKKLTQNITGTLRATYSTKDDELSTVLIGALVIVGIVVTVIIVFEKKKRS